MSKQFSGSIAADSSGITLKAPAGVPFTFKLNAVSHTYTPRIGKQCVYFGECEACVIGLGPGDGEPITLDWKTIDPNSPLLQPPPEPQFGDLRAVPCPRERGRWRIATFGPRGWEPKEDATYASRDYAEWIIQGMQDDE